MKKVITESELTELIKESVTRILSENQEEEGWFGDKFNQAKSATNTMFQGNGTKSIKDRFNNAKKNWNTQGELNGLNELLQQLVKFVENGQLNPQMTIAQLIGGKYNNNKFGSLTSRIGNRQSQIAKRGGKSY